TRSAGALRSSPSRSDTTGRCGGWARTRAARCWPGRTWPPSTSVAGWSTPGARCSRSAPTTPPPRRSATTSSLGSPGSPPRAARTPRPRDSGRSPPGPRGGQPKQPAIVPTGSQLSGTLPKTQVRGIAALEGGAVALDGEVGGDVGPASPLGARGTEDYRGADRRDHRACTAAPRDGFLILATVTCADESRSK